MLDVTPRDGNVIDVWANGVITKRDFSEAEPRIEDEMMKHAKIRLLLNLQNVRGVQPRVLFEEARFGLKHRREIERIAVVGDKHWERLGTQLAKPVITGDVRYFDTRDTASAHAWIRAPPEP